MPSIRIDMFEGRSPDQKRALVAAITEACTRTLGISPESVDIILFDVPKQHWATGGTFWSEKGAPAKPPSS
jgi:4-oxalocrotonate tautomerase